MELCNFSNSKSVCVCVCVCVYLVTPSVYNAHHVEACKHVPLMFQSLSKAIWCDS